MDKLADTIINQLLCCRDEIVDSGNILSNVASSRELALAPSSQDRKEADEYRNSVEHEDKLAVLSCTNDELASMVTVSGTSSVFGSFSSFSSDTSHLTRAGSSRWSKRDHITPSTKKRMLLRLSSSSLRRLKLEEEESMNLDDFLFIKSIGSGSFSEVMLVRKRQSPDLNRLFAMKCLRKQCSENFDSRVQAERKVLEILNSPFISCLRYALQTPLAVYLLTEYCEGGSLLNHISNKGMDEKRARFHAAELVLATEHIHEHFIVHRDLKPANILITRHGHLVVTDFGLSATNVSLESQHLSTFAGTIGYSPPEILRGLRYGHQCDWWSLGIVLFEMVHGVTPFYSPEPRTHFANILKKEPDIAETSSDGLRSLLRNLLCKDSKVRLGSGVNGSFNVKSSSFFVDVDWQRMADLAVPTPYRPSLNDDSRRDSKRLLESSTSIRNAKALSHEFSSKNANKSEFPHRKLTHFKQFSFSYKSITTEIPSWSLVMG